MSFAHLKRNLGLTRLRLRGRGGARDEFWLLPPFRTSGNSPAMPWPPPHRSELIGRGSTRAAAKSRIKPYHDLPADFFNIG
jgi:hypothetical protein